MGMTEVEGRAKAWAASEMERIKLVATGGVAISDYAAEIVRCSLESTFTIAFEAGKVDGERAARVKGRK